MAHSAGSAPRRMRAHSRTCCANAAALPPSLAPNCAEGGEGGEGSGDPRAALVLQLLLASLEQPAPNLAHLLCGFDFDGGERQTEPLLQCCVQGLPVPAARRGVQHACTKQLTGQELAAARIAANNIQPNLNNLRSDCCVAGMGQVFLPDPRAQYNVLRVLLAAVQVCAGPRWLRLLTFRVTCQVHAG